MIIFEFDKKFNKPGKFITTLSGKKFYRFWIWFFAITFTEFDLKSLHDYIATGNTVWRK